MSDSAILWIVARQAPLSVGFPKHESWSGLPFPSPGDLSNPGIEPRSPALQADALPSEQINFGNNKKACSCVLAAGTKYILLL